MSGYADTGFLCSLYAPDAHTARAVARMRRQALPLPLTWLHHLELRNGAGARHGKFLTFDHRQAALARAAGLKVPTL